MYTSPRVSPMPSSSRSSSLPACADEREALLVLVEPGSLADEHEVGVGLPTPNTTCVRPSASRQRVQPEASAA